MWRPAAQSHVALWEDDRVRPAGRQPAEVQQLRLLVWLRWTGDSSGRLGPVGVSVGGALEVRGRSLTDGDFLHRCCKLHDHCYEASRKIPGCSGVADLPYVIDYDFTCSNRQVACSATNDQCQAAVCECDRVAAHCFARNTYNPENKNLDPDVHCGQ
uniref:Phospholipase A2 n=1 Tax=Cynoglossus semilaevis TaxID=244447 RepID=A0A3P8VPG5_CYNSE